MESLNDVHLLICGLGSIGRKHLRCFRDLGVSRIDAYRSGRATLSNSGLPAPDQVFTDLDSALEEHPTIVIVANPTSLHVPTALQAVRAGCHVLVEKPLGHITDGCLELDDEINARGLVGSVACNLRFHPSLLKLREWIRTREPLGDAI
ncbi:MAG: Gfo/Idh/MocA family oxidoreductase, partial [Pyrinomonadaceae bacterium]|nr:Gfo/Idh/MocA family oxidoreductase [Pyrinomonadaceae bacterium]